MERKFKIGDKILIISMYDNRTLFHGEIHNIIDEITYVIKNESYNTHSWRHKGEIQIDTEYYRNKGIEEILNEKGSI